MNDEPVDGGAPAESVAQPATDNGAWYDVFAEDIRENQNITKFNSAEELAKSYINVQHLIGADKIPMPVTEDDWANTYAKLGRPEEPTGYEIKAPEGVEVDEARQGKFLELAHSIGLSQKQAEALAEFDFSSTQESMENLNKTFEQSTQEALDGLKKEWGNAYDQNVEIYKRAVGEFADESTMDFLKNTLVGNVALGDHPAIVKLMSSIGKGMMESGKLEGKGAEMALTPAQLQDKQAQLMANPAYTNRNHPEHKAINRQVQELFKLQFPE